MMNEFFLILRLNLYSMLRSSNLYTQTIPKFAIAIVFYTYAIRYSFYSASNNFSFENIQGQTKFYLFVIFADLISRIVFRKMPEEPKTFFHLLPIKRILLFEVTIFKSLINFFNISWLVLVIPFFAKYTEPENIFLFCIFLFLISLLNDYLAVFVKLVYKQSNFLYTVFLLLFVLWVIFKVGIASSIQDQLIQINKPGILMILFLLLLIGCLNIAIVMLYKRSLYNTYRTPGRYFHLPRSRYCFFIGTYFLLHTRLIFRNRRLITMLFSTILLILMSVVLFCFGEFIDLYLKYYLFTCLNGALGFTIGYHLFSADSNYLQLIHAGSFNYSTYIKTKYWLINFSTIIIGTFGLLFFTTVIGDVILFASNMILVMGICNLLIILLGIYNSQKIVLSQSSFANSQGTDIFQMLYVTFLSFIPVIILFLSEKFPGEPGQFYILFAIGILSVFLSNIIIEKYLSPKFKNLKYKKILKSWE